ncbi:MAG: crossover junction endodeoxyribonuclease RuvC [Pseudomonadota bacterium]
MDKLRVIGVDPGLAETGYAIVEVSQKRGIAREWDSISTDPKDSMPRRLQSIFTSFVTIIKKWDIRVVVLEDVFVLPKYPNAALQLGAVKGVLQLGAAMHNLKVMELKPTEVKMALTGNGRANKEQVERSVRKILMVQEVIKPKHASDALALALVGLSRSGLVRW